MQLFLRAMFLIALNLICSIYGADLTLHNPDLLKEELNRKSKSELIVLVQKLQKELEITRSINKEMVETNNNFIECHILRFDLEQTLFKLKSTMAQQDTDIAVLKRHFGDDKNT
jgi:hypothetical protein